MAMDRSENTATRAAAIAVTHKTNHQANASDPTLTRGSLIDTIDAALLAKAHSLVEQQDRSLAIQSRHFESACLEFDRMLVAETPTARSQSLAMDSRAETCSSRIRASSEPARTQTRISCRSLPRVLRCTPATGFIAS
jgi:histidine ammonia-lyase